MGQEQSANCVRGNECKNIVDLCLVADKQANKIIIFIRNIPVSRKKITIDKVKKKE